MDGLGVSGMLPGDRDAMRRAFQEHYAALVRLAIALCGGREIAEDIVQDAFVAAASHLGGLPPEEVRPYLRRAVVNRWKNRIRRLALEARHRGAMPGPGSESSRSLEDRDVVWRALMRLRVDSARAWSCATTRT